MTILDRAIAHWRATEHDVVNDRLTDLSGNGHHAVLGSAVGVDTNDPTVLVHGGVQYLWLPGANGNFASTPTAVALDPTDDIEIRVDIALDDYSPATNQEMFSRYVAAGSHRQWHLSVNSSGNLSLGLGDGSGAFRANLVVTAGGFTDGQRVQIRVTLDANNGIGNTEVEFFERPPTEALDADTVAWTQIGATQTAVGVQSWKAVTADLEVGANEGINVITGKAYRALYWKDLTKTTLAFDSDFTNAANVTPESDTFTESSPNAATVTINRSATGRKSSVVHRSLALLGTDDYFEVADHPDLDFALDESFTIIYAGRVYDLSPSGFESFIAKSASGEGGWSLDSTTGDTFRFLVQDGTVSPLDVMSPDAVVGVAFVIAGRRDVVLDQIEGFMNGVGSGSPTTDTTTGTSANARAIGIGARLGNIADSFQNSEYFASALFREALSGADILAGGIELLVPIPSPVGGGQFLPAGWGGPAAPPRGTGPPGGAASGAPTGTVPGYGNIDVAVRARQLADAVCDGVTVAARGQQSTALSLVQLLRCLQGRGVPHAPQSVERSLELIFRELAVARPHNVTLAQELDIIAAHLP